MWESRRPPSFLRYPGSLGFDFFGGVFGRDKATTETSPKLFYRAICIAGELLFIVDNLKL